jgi:hypothetical protein
MSNNFYNDWAKRIINDGLRFIKIIIGIGLSYSLGLSLSLPVGILFFGWVLVEALQEKK